MPNSRQQSTQVAIDVNAPKRNRRRSRQERAQIEQILLEPFFFVPSPLLRRKHAERMIFEDIDEVPRNTVSWYCPAIDVDGSKPVKTGMLLNRPQETILFRQYNYARKQVQKLQEKISTSKKQDENDLDALLHWYGISTEKRDHIVECNLALVLAMAKRSWATGEYADLVAEGNIALLRCVERFDCELGYKFSTYACRALTTAFNRFGKKQIKHKGHQSFDAETTKEPVIIIDQESFVSDEHVALMSNAVRCVDSQLTPVEQDVLRFRFGIHAGQNPPQLTLERAGKELGISKERVRQIQMRALRKIRAHIETNHQIDLLAS